MLNTNSDKRIKHSVRLASNPDSLHSTLLVVIKYSEDYSERNYWCSFTQTSKKRMCFKKIKYM